MVNQNPQTGWTTESWYVSQWLDTGKLTFKIFRLHCPVLSHPRICNLPTCLLLSLASRLALAAEHTTKRTAEFDLENASRLLRKHTTQKLSSIRRGKGRRQSEGDTMVSLTPHRLSSAAYGKNLGAQKRHNTLAHQEIFPLSNPKVCLMDVRPKRQCWLGRASFKRLGLENGSAAWGSRASPRKPRPASGQPSPARYSPLHPLLRPPTSAPAARAASRPPPRPHARTHTRPQRPGFPPLVSAPRRRVRVQRGPAEGGSSHWPRSPRRRLGPGSALHFLVPRLDARSRQPPRRRSENARASLGAPPPSFHDDRSALKSCPPR